ncbi:CBS domain-containing protein [Candidatus Amoebophilus asiaticus]|nr:CBS domain-containing protein [Candidatus Amoebophilus asiaticus]
MRNQALYAIIALLFLSFHYTYAGSAGCTFADECTNADTIPFCTVITATNSGCTACGHCDSTIDTFTPGSTPDWGVNDHCDMAWANGGTSGTYVDPCGECTAYIVYTMGMTLPACYGSYSFCDSPQKTSYGTICIPASFPSTVAVYLSVYNISCNGGDTSLQWGIYPAGSDTQCANLASNWPDGQGMLYCSNGTDTNETISLNLNSGNCYLVFFDGRYGSLCTWNFFVDTTSFVPVFTNGFLLDTVIYDCDTCLSITNTGTGFDSISWTTSDGQFSNDTNPTFCFTSEDIFTVTQTLYVNDSRCIISMDKDIIVACECVPPMVDDTLLNTSNGTACDGSIDLTLLAITTPYTFSWSNGTITEDQNNLCAGTYTVTISYGFELVCDTLISYNIPGCTPPTFNDSILDVSDDSACDGSIDISFLSITSPYTFIWSNGSDSLDQYNLCAGPYTITISYGMGLSCDTIIEFTVGQDTTTGIKSINHQINSHFNLYPNPFKDGMLMTRDLARREGIFVGNSAGCAVAGLLQIKDQLKEDDLVVLIFHDHGSRYVGKIFNDDWMRERGFLDDKPILARDIIKNKYQDEVITLSTDKSVANAIELMQETNISQIPITQNGDIVGSVTERLIFNNLLKDPNVKSEKLQTIMRDPFPLVKMNTPVTELSNMINKENSAVLVKDESGDTHIITEYDVIFAISR